MNKRYALSILMVACALSLWSSGVVPAIIPAMVPAANKQGSTGQKFVIGTGSFTAGNCPTTDASGNLIDSGIATCGGAGTAVNSWNGATGAVTYTTQNSGSNLTNRLKLNFMGNLTATDNPGTGATDVTSSGGTSVGAIASRPAAGTAGRTYIPTDSWYSILYDNGSTWQYFRNGRQVSPPVDSDYSWVNQNGATDTAQTNGAVTISVPVQPSGLSLAIRTATAPATPYTKTFRFGCTVTQNNDNECGVGLRESGTGKVVLMTFRPNAAAIVVRKYTNATTLSADYVTQDDYRQVYFGMPHVCLRVGDNGTNTTFEYSGDDGGTWTLLINVAKNDFFTTAPDQYCFYAASNNATWPVGITVYSVD